MINKSHIYAFKRTDDDSYVYIGKHNGSRKDYFTGSHILNKNLKINGKEWFDDYYKKELITEGDFTKEKLNELEMFYIEKHNTLRSKNPKAYNLTKGGDGAAHKHSEKTKQKIGDFHSIKVAKLDKDTGETIEIFPSAREAAKQMNVHSSTITKAISRRTINCKGFTWIKLNY